MAPSQDLLSNDEPEPEIITIEGIRTCADTDGDGTINKFDCTGQGKILGRDPSMIPCSGDTYTAEDCCIRTAETCRDTTRDEDYQTPFDCSGSEFGLDEDRNCPGGEGCTEDDCCRRSKRKMTHRELGMCSSATEASRAGAPAGPCTIERCNNCCGIQTEMPDGTMKIYGPHCHEWQCGYGYEAPTYVKERLGDHPEPSDLAGANWGGSIGPLPDLKDYFTDCLSPRSVDTTSLRGDGYNYTKLVPANRIMIKKNKLYIYNMKMHPITLTAIVVVIAGVVFAIIKFTGDDDEDRFAEMQALRGPTVDTRERPGNEGGGSGRGNRDDDVFGGEAGGEWTPMDTGDLYVKLQIYALRIKLLRTV